MKISIANGGNGSLKEPKEHGYTKEFNYKLRNCILELYKNICQSCLMPNRDHFIIYGRSLECHHIDYNKENNDIFNFVPLCKKCNIKANKNKKIWQDYFENIVFDLRFSLLGKVKENRLKNCWKEYGILKKYFKYRDNSGCRGEDGQAWVRPNTSIKAAAKCSDEECIL